jgi:hypothetical protein
MAPDNIKSLDGLDDTISLDGPGQYNIDRGLDDTTSLDGLDNTISLDGPDNTISLDGPTIHHR